ncbi:NAD-dependent epimerase/dehydratase family protein [Streptomyces sp. BR1]|uniref:NAD-dependent epimerase/dehydratase family protein n=1 Tax=Streptomyces sp. BR1 TaxID=1592323 RepID=UPI00402B114F
MRILVTGATGQVGRRYVPRLLQRSDVVRVLVRDEARGHALGAHEVAVGDVRDTESVRKALAGVDAVVNLAVAYRNVPEEENRAVNGEAAVALGRSALEAGVSRFVQVSSNLAYGRGRGRPLTEDDEPLPGGPLWGPYSESKAAAEAALLALHRDHGLDVRIGALAFVYGEGDPHLAASIHWASQWAGHQRLPMVHHADVAQGLTRLLYAPGVAGRKYNIADDSPVTAVELHQLNGVEVPPELAERTDPDPFYTIVSTLRIRDELGFRPLYPSVWTARDAGVL